MKNLILRSLVLKRLVLALFLWPAKAVLAQDPLNTTRVISDQTASGDLFLVPASSAIQVQSCRL